MVTGPGAAFLLWEDGEGGNGYFLLRIFLGRGGDVVGSKATLSSSSTMRGSKRL